MALSKDAQFESQKVRIFDGHDDDGTKFEELCKMLGLQAALQANTQLVDELFAHFGDSSGSLRFEQLASFWAAIDDQKKADPSQNQLPPLSQEAWQVLCAELEVSPDAGLSREHFDMFLTTYVSEDMVRILHEHVLGWVYPEATIGKQAFAAACRAQPDQTVVGNSASYLSSGWFEKLRLDLVEERSCIADLCTCCGL